MSFFIRKGGTGGKNSLVGKKRKANYEGKGKKFKKVSLLLFSGVRNIFSPLLGIYEDWQRFFFILYLLHNDKHVSARVILLYVQEVVTHFI